MIKTQDSRYASTRLVLVAALTMLATVVLVLVVGVVAPESAPAGEVGSGLQLCGGA